VAEPDPGVPGLSRSHSDDHQLYPKAQNEYKDNLFTSGMVGWPGIPHITDMNFKPVIDRALELPGFQEDKNGKQVTVGFARNAVLGVADKVIAAVKSKAIRHFFLVAGCDGAKPEEITTPNSWKRFRRIVWS